MLMFEWTLVLLLAAVILTNLADRLAVPYPSLLAIAGVGLAFLPFAPQIRIEPELSLALFVAPALLDAAFDPSPRDLRRNAIPIASLAVIAVVLTTAAVAFLGWRFAGLPIAAANRCPARSAVPPARARRDWRRSLSPHPGRARLVRARRRAGRKFSIADELRRAIVLSVRALEYL